MNPRVRIDSLAIELSGDKSVALARLAPYSFEYESIRYEPRKIISSVSVYYFELLIGGFTGRCL